MAESRKTSAAAGRDVTIAGRDQVIVSVTDHDTAPTEPTAPGLLPRDVPGFTGRKEELDRLLGLAGGAVVVTAIGGTAGVGKTALAVHAAHRLLPQFPDGHLYADLRGYTAGQDPVEPDEVLEVFLRCLAVPGQDIPASAEERSGLFRQLLASRRMLLVLDNARTEAQVRPLLPGAGESLVIITSRSALAGLEADERLDLDVLSDCEATALLTAVIGSQRTTAEPRAVQQVRDRCGRLPLALRIAGQLLAAHPAWTVTRLADMLADEEVRLERLAVGDRQVRAAFAVSYRQLTDEDARMFRLLGLYPGPDFDVAAAASLAGNEPAAARPVLDRLVLAHLVAEDAAGRFAMHDLLRLFARGMCRVCEDRAARRAAEERLVRHYVTRAEFFDDCLSPQQRPPVAGAPVPSVREALALFEVERPCLLAAVDLAAGRGWDERVWQLSEGMGDALTVLRYLDDLLGTREAALAAARHAGDQAAEGRALNNLGNTYADLRRFDEAIACYQDALVIKRCTRDLLGEGRTLNNLASAYRDLRRFDEAIAHYQGALMIHRLTGDRHGEGQTLNNLGNSYANLGRFGDAIACYVQDIALCRETGDRHSEGRTLNNLGSTYADLRRFDEAIACQRNALAIHRETGDRIGEGRALNNLGSTYQELRLFGEAIACYQQSLGLKRVTGDRHGEGHTLNNLGETYADLRRFDEAVACYQQSLAIEREMADRHGEGQTMDNLGDVYRDLRQPDQAAACWRGAAAAMRDAGDYDQAARLAEKVAKAVNVRCRRRYFVRVWLRR